MICLSDQRHAIATKSTKPKVQCRFCHEASYAAAHTTTDVMPQYRTYPCAGEVVDYWRLNQIAAHSRKATVCWQQNTAVMLMQCCHLRYGACLGRNIKTCRTAVHARHNCLLQSSKLKSPQGRSTLPPLQCCIYSQRIRHSVPPFAQQQQVHSTTRTRAGAAHSA
jgi:hypothetical protein